MSGFNKTCIYCNKEIRLSNDTGRWLPYNLDNTAHECKKSNEQQQQPLPPQNKKQITLEDIEARLERIEHTLYGSK